MSEEQKYWAERERLAEVLERLARTQANLPLPLTIEEAADLRAAARALQGR